jgi:hypothetical protein
LNVFGPLTFSLFLYQAMKFHIPDKSLLNLVLEVRNHCSKPSGNYGLLKAMREGPIETLKCVRAQLLLHLPQGE